MGIKRKRKGAFVINFIGMWYTIVLRGGERQMQHGNHVNAIIPLLSMLFHYVGMRDVKSQTKRTEIE